MQANKITLSIPASYEYARTVRMMASNLAVVCKMNMDDVEDIRMAAEEGFVYCCATKPSSCELVFSVSAHSFAMDFALGDEDFSSKQEEDSCGVDSDMSFVELTLQAVCDEFDVTSARMLHLAKHFNEVAAAEGSSSSADTLAQAK